jgi:hypothetical protein
MSGVPQLICPVPITLIQVDMDTLTIENPIGTPVQVVDSTKAFYVSVTLKAGGFATLLPVPYSIKYYFNPLGGGPVVTQVTPTLFLNAGGVASGTCPGATEYKDAVTRLTVPANTLAQDAIYQITAVADFAATPGVDAFLTTPAVISTTP